MKRRASGLGLFCVLTVATATMAQAPMTVGAGPIQYSWMDPIIHVGCWLIGLDCTPKDIPGVWTPSVTKRP